MYNVGAGGNTVMMNTDQYNGQININILYHVHLRLACCILTSCNSVRLSESLHK